ncbi:hypothetical protein CTKZ_00480 [Cellulomonas algicola]|uniref:Uncharacterized protein n=1 Tax=Cellulomonas algicola TaxID=2071633 RepID=A0A401UUX8_9CELL|nr:hypothetical protein CTKZ_00480 [Cellulomonas algicola]
MKSAACAGAATPTMTNATAAAATADLFLTFTTYLRNGANAPRSGAWQTVARGDRAVRAGRPNGGMPGSTTLQP